MRLDLLLRISAKIFIPFIMIFAFYVQFHGDFGPGGGFQAGVIFAASIILYTIIFGAKKAQKDFLRLVFKVGIENACKEITPWRSRLIKEDIINLLR